MRRLARLGIIHGSLFHMSSHVKAAGAAAVQKAKPEQPKTAKPPESNKVPDKPANAPSDKVMRLVNELADLSVVDFADLTEQLKKRLGLDNANVTVPMMMPAGMVMPGMAGAPGAAPAVPAAEEKPAEKQVFDVKLEKYEAADKIKVIKEVRAFTALGLKEAKDLVEKLPAIVKKSVTKDEATEILNKLKAAGGVAVME